MPFDVLTQPDQTRVAGPLNIVNDPQAYSLSSSSGGSPAIIGSGSGNLNVAGTAVVTGTASFASNASISGAMNVTGTASFASGLTASSASLGGLNSSFSAGLIVSGGANLDTMFGGAPAASTSSQSLSTSGVAITMTSITSQHVLLVSANTTTATCVLTPTSSAATTGAWFNNGQEVTLINIAPSGSNVLLPSTSMGSSGIYAYTLSAGHATKFVYSAPMQTWYPENAA